MLKQLQGQGGLSISVLHSTAQEMEMTSETYHLLIDLQTTRDENRGPISPLDSRESGPYQKGHREMMENRRKRRRKKRQDRQRAKWTKGQRRLQ